MKEYITLAPTEYTVEVIIEKSRFIASCIGVTSVDEATAFIAEKRKKYYDATHNCYAYIVGDKAKFSDDGEPQGTAGLPIMDCIKNNNLDYLCVVVTRYFGGIKLGAGGLVRAYSGAAAEALKAATKVQMRLCCSFDVTVDYSMLKTLRKAMQGVALEKSVDFADKVTVHFLILADLSTTITDIVLENTLGKAEITVTEPFISQYET